MHQYFGKVAVPEGFKEFNELIGPTCSPRNWQRNRGLRLSGTKNEISHKNRARRELEINGFLHNSRGTNKIDSNHPIHNKSRYL